MNTGSFQLHLIFSCHNNFFLKRLNLHVTVRDLIKFLLIKGGALQEGDIEEERSFNLAELKEAIEKVKKTRALN